MCEGFFVIEKISCKGRLRIEFGERKSLTGLRKKKIFFLMKSKGEVKRPDFQQIV